MNFALSLFFLLSLFIAVGSFIESYSSTQVAKIMVYSNPIFLILQVVTFLSVYLSTIERLPFKKRLTGFYILHLGILFLLFGSGLSFFSGFESLIQLKEGDSYTQEVELPETLLVIKDTKNNKLYEYEFSESVFLQNINITLHDFILKKYIPYGLEDIQWKESENGAGFFSVKNSFTEEKFYLSIDNKEYPFHKDLGPLNFEFYDEKIKKCILDKGGWILWNTRNYTCNTLIKLEQTSSQKKFYTFGDIVFFPEIGPYPLSQSTLEPVQDSSWLLFSKSFFLKDKKILLFNDNSLVYLHENNVLTQLLPSSLPWMDIEIKSLQIEKNKSPHKIPYAIFPKKDSKTMEYALLSYKDSEFYLSFNDIVRVDSFEIYLKKKKFLLPFLIKLHNFEVLYDKESDKPSSYKSYIWIQKDSEEKLHSVFMNNPFKTKNLHCYQNSYTQTDAGYISVLNINYDPGRFLKYLGSFLLALGTLIHGFIKYKK